MSQKRGLGGKLSFFFSLGARSMKRLLAPLSDALPRIVFRLICLVFLDAFALWFFWKTLIDGVWFLAVVIAIITLGTNVIFLRDDLYPLRWISPGLALMLLMVIYPTAYTIYTAFTNYSSTHLLTKQQAIYVIETEVYLPEDAISYKWTAFRSSEGQFAIWLISEDGQMFLAKPGEPIQHSPHDNANIGALDQDGIPISIKGYERLSRIDAVRYLTELSAIEFGLPPETITIKSLDVAAQYRQRYHFDRLKDAIIDLETGETYRAVEGTFTSSNGATLSPSFHVPIGWRNFHRLFAGVGIQGPLFRVFIWTIVFALSAVLTTFALGLLLAVLFNDPVLPPKYRKAIRSILLLPYVIPFYLSILTWRGMMNPYVGIINKILESLIRFSPPWLSDPSWAKAGILLINLWLGFPYMLLITTGALQAIPSEINDASEVDGASEWQRFWYITLPLLLISVGPLLIFSFAFNFNNFNVIYLFNSGGPPMPNTLTPVGHTDILISYSFRLAFEGGRGGDYGFASAITIIIFIVLAIITLFQFRYARIWEEVSENV